MSINLNEWRADPTLWSAAAYTEVEDSYGDPEDACWKTRSAVLDQLQRDRQDSDVELLRFLVRQEILMHAESWGIADTIRRAAMLLGECRHPEDVWLLWEAKTANVDTYTGIEGAVIYSAGRAETQAHIRSVDHPDRAALLEYTEQLNSELPTERDLDERIASLRAYFGG